MSCNSIEHISRISQPYEIWISNKEKKVAFCHHCSRKALCYRIVAQNSIIIEIL